MNKLQHEKLNHDNKSVAKFVSLKNLSLGSIETVCKELLNLSEVVPTLVSPKAVLFNATKVRNVRNALRNIKGAKRIRSTSKESHLTLRILSVSSHPGNS